MAKLYAARIARRAITILDVPAKLRDEVMGLLTDFDRERMEKIIGGVN